MLRAQAGLPQGAFSPHRVLSVLTGCFQPGSDSEEQEASSPPKPRHGRPSRAGDGAARTPSATSSSAEGSDDHIIIGRESERERERASESERGRERQRASSSSAEDSDGLRSAPVLLRHGLQMARRSRGREERGGG